MTVQRNLALVGEPQDSLVKSGFVYILEVHGTPQIAQGNQRSIGGGRNNFDHPLKYP